MKVVPKYKYAKFDMHDKLGKEKKRCLGCRIMFTRQKSKMTW